MRRFLMAPIGLLALAVLRPQAVWANTGGAYSEAEGIGSVARSSESREVRRSGISAQGGASTGGSAPQGGGRRRPSTCSTTTQPYGPTTGALTYVPIASEGQVMGVTR